MRKLFTKNRGTLLFSAFFILLLNTFPYSSTVAQSDQKNATNISHKEDYANLIKEVKQINEAIKHAKNAVETFADSSFLPTLLFQLSELELQREKRMFELSMMKYDLQLSLFEKGRRKEPPVEPFLTYKKTLEINNRIIKDFPHVPFINNVLYRNGLCLYEIGRKDSAKHIFSRLIQENPDSTILAKILFRLGECYFEEGDYEQALQTYKKILESWESPFFSMALYKIAWCHYKLNNISDAISAFYYLLTDIRFMAKLDSEILGKSQLELKQETIEYIALSFSDFGGTSSLVDFLQKMGESEYDAELLFRLGKIYLQRDFYEDAIEAFEYLISEYNSFPKLPQVFLYLYDCFEKLGQQQTAFKVHDRYLHHCGPGSPWATDNSEATDRTLFNNTLLELRHKIATPYLSSADSLFAREDYRKAAKKYAKFLKIFFSDERADHAQFCLADCYFNLKRYKRAAKAYKTLVLNFPNSELKEDAAYNYIVCYDEMMNPPNAARTDSTIRSAAKQNTRQLIKACQNFIKWIPDSEKVPEIKLKLAEVFYRLELYKASEKYARSVLVSILKQRKGEQYKTSAIHLLAQIKFKQKKFAEAGRLFSTLMRQNPDSTHLIEKWSKMAASSQFKIGEQLKEKGKIQQAAFEFERTALRASDPQIAQAALFEAALQYEKAGKHERAAKNFEQLYTKYPNSEKAKEAIYRAAVLRENLAQYYFAAKDYLDLYKLISATPEGASALFNAGLAYEKAKDWLAVAETFTRYTVRFPNDHDRILEAMFKIAYAYEQNHNSVKATFAYRKLLNKYNQLISAGQFADDYFAARATFRMAELKNQQFQVIKLVPPFQQNLARKQKMFNEMLKMYVEVTKFDIAEWTTASFYRIGLAYEEFCRDILNSPAPAQLSRRELESYWAGIQQQLIIPLQKEALKYYKTNETLAFENSLNNEWVEKTKSRIIFLNRKLAMNNTAATASQLKQAAGRPEKLTYKQARKQL